MITLKHLARELDMDPYKMRATLRQKFGIRRRWRWDPTIPADQQHLTQVKDYLKSSIDTTKDKT